MEGEAAMSAFANMLEARGVTRRDFMKLCGTVAAAAGLSQLTVPQVAQALETSVIGATKGNLYPVIWVEGASCTGCTESFAQAQTPNAAEVVLDSHLPELLRDAVRCSGLLHGGGQGADHRGRRLHPHLRRRHSGEVGRQRPARGRQARHRAPDRGRKERQRRGRAGFLRRQRRLDGR